MIYWDNYEMDVQEGSTLPKAPDSGNPLLPTEKGRNVVESD